MPSIKRLWFLLVLLIAVPVMAQTAAPCTFSPAAGTYAVPQSVTMSSTAGAFIAYTLDGSTPNIASTQYTGPITVSTSETIKCIAAIVGFKQLNAQNNDPSVGGTYWKIAQCGSFTGWSSSTAYVSGNKVSASGFNWVATASSTNKTPASNPSFWSKFTSNCAADNPGGTGVATSTSHTSGNASPSLSGASMLFAETAQLSAQTNVLWPPSSSFGTCDSCTYFLEDHWYYWASANSSSNEDDMFQFNSTTGFREMNGGQYCFAGCPSGTAGWDYGGNSNISWTYSGVNAGGTLNVWHHIQKVMHRVVSEDTSKPCTASGSFPYLYWDLLEIDGVQFNNGGPGWKYCQNALPTGWASGAAMQEQIDIGSHGSTTSSQVYWDNINFFAMHDPTSPVSAAFTITGSAPSGPTLNRGHAKYSGSYVLQ